VRYGRRDVLKGLLTAGVISPLAYRLARPALAASGAPRLLTFYIPNGVIPNLWFPQGGETDFTLPAMSAPLEAIRNDLVFLRGVDMYNAGSTHEGVDTVLTGGADQSIDVFIGAALAGQTAFESVQLGVATNFQSEGTICYAGPGQVIKPNDDPVNAFDTLFGNFMPGEPSKGPTLAQRRSTSIIDHSVTSLGRLRGRLGTEDQAKLDTHLDSLRQLERRFDGTATIACESIVWNTEGFANDPTVYYPLTYDDPQNIEVVAKLQMDLAVLALSCDVTRVVTLQLLGNVSEFVVPGSGNGNYHQTTHYACSAPEAYVQLRHWSLEKWIYLIEQMRTTPSPNGTLLDDSLVFMCSEISDGTAHNHRDMPYVLAGKAGGRLQTGRYLDYRSGDVPVIECQGITEGGPRYEPHNKLLVSIANAMGVEIDSYGYTGGGTGGLPGLFTS